MKKVFVSSVVGGLEELRRAAKQAITTMDMTPVMCEDFSARPYSPEIACLHEVAQSDIYVVIVGKDFGFDPGDGISVTQAEFREARKCGKQILALVQEVDGRCSKQQEFLAEVEAYSDGLFRASFADALGLSNALIKALRHTEVMSQAITTEAFESRVDELLSARNHYDDRVELQLAFMPQPAISIDIDNIEAQMDRYFGRLCEAGTARYQDGYKLLDERRYTGLSSGRHSAYFGDDGLIVLASDPVTRDDHFFSGSFVIPETITEIAQGFLALIDERAGYVRLALTNMGNSYVAHPPSGNAMRMRIFENNDGAEFSHLFLPLTKASYSDWVQSCVKKLSRTFRYED